MISWDQQIIARKDEREHTFSSHNLNLSSKELLTVILFPYPTIDTPPDLPSRAESAPMILQQ